MDMAPTIMTASVIGLHGRMGVGKDTFASIFEEIVSAGHCLPHHREIRKLSFADPVRRAAALLCGWPMERVLDPKAKNEVDPFWGFSPRKVMQLIGTEFGRQMLRDDIWVQRMQLELNAQIPTGVTPVITDVRFENEAEFIRANRGVIVHIVPQASDVGRIDLNAHESERGIAWKQGDLFVVNDKSLGRENFRNEIMRLLNPS